MPWANAIMPFQGSKAALVYALKGQQQTAQGEALCKANTLNISPVRA